MRNTSGIFFSIICALALAVMTVACSNGERHFDASGTFEAEEVIVSALATGTIMDFDIQEGDLLRAGQMVGYIDSTQLFLKKRQLESQIRSTLVQKPDIRSQIASLQVQLASAEREQRRVENLLAAGAASQKQLDDSNSQVEIIRKQLLAQQSALGITTASITEQTSPIRFQIAQLEDQLVKSRILNPIDGTVLTKYTNEFELATSGKPLYKVADLSQLTLRAYVSGDQLTQVKLGTKATVFVDDEVNMQRSLEGIVEWVSDKAEFTPKTIQTKNERANLVYATKIRVKNDGTLKIGMYAEVKF